MIIFPLSWPGKIVLIIIALVIGLIFAMMMWPDLAKKIFRKDFQMKPREIEQQEVLPKKRKVK